MKPSIFEVKFEGVSDVHMSSPYGNAYKTFVRGPVDLDFGCDFQNIYAEDTANKILYLVKWAIDPVIRPGFHVMKIDPKVRGVFYTPTIMGCCDKISCTNEGVTVVAMQFIDPKATGGQFNPIFIKDFPLEFKDFK